MAKLKAPLMSLGASGALGKALVFFGWKGLDVVREYVVPANPKTAAQVIQRDYLKEGVAKIHTAMADATTPLIEVDQVAYAALASAKGKIMTWFNQAVKLWVDGRVAGKLPVVYGYWQELDLDHEAFIIWLDVFEKTSESITSGKFYFGTSKTNLIHAVTAENDPGVKVWLNAVDLSAWMVAGTKYYVQFRPDSGSPSVGADSGIYNFVAE